MSDTRMGGGPPTSVNIFLTRTLSPFTAPQRSVSPTYLAGIGSHVPSPPPALPPACFLQRGFSLVSSPFIVWTPPPPRFPPPANAVKRQYLRGYSGSNVKTPNRRFWRMLQKSGGGTFVIPDAKGTCTFVNMSCQSNHMKWNASMILA